MTVDDLDRCGCCGDPVPAPDVYNPPGLDALSYRMDTHGEILRRMLARLPLEPVEAGPNALRYPLARLTTRSADDPAIAWLDAWATVGDVLTFYQERIANEGFLRTATERRSILELARLIGYELNPGVAAAAFLAFLTDTAAGAPRSVVVPKGARVQSVPGQDELPQMFETSADITARVEWNRVQPRRMRPQQLAINGGKLYLLGGGSSSLAVADTSPLDLDAALVLGQSVAATEVDAVYAAGTSTNLRPGDVILLAGRKAGQTTTATLMRTVRRIEEEPALDRTRVEFDIDTPAPKFTATGITALATMSVKQAAFDSKNVDDLVVGQTWSEGELSAWLSVQGWNAANTVNYIYGAYSTPSPAPAPPGGPGVFAMRAKLGFFGHNAPAYGSLTAIAASPFSNWDGGLSVWMDSLTTAGDPPYYGDADCFLERSVAGITANSWAVLELPTRQFTAFRVTAASESSLVGYSLSAKTTGLQLGSAADGIALGDSDADKSESFNVRKTTAHVLSERLTLSQLPVEDPLGKGTAEETTLTLDRMVLNLTEGQPIAVTGERDDLPGVVVSEVVLLTTVQHSGGFTTLFFESPGLTFRYVRATVSLCANVVEATHGESVKEVLGSGDGSRPNQRFVLRKPPLTYTASSGADGAESSLEVRVDGVAWSETPRLYGSQAADEQYLTRRDDDGRVSVVFGDGVQGARLPSGVENVVATYRSGIGRAGMVPPGSLTLLMTRPLGIHDVTNPLAASGAADPERRDEARRNAPLTVLAMERVVSLQDAEDFSRAFAGIGKCSAMALSRGGARWIHLTVAAAAPKSDPGGLAAAMADYRVEATSTLRTHLDDALAAAGEPSLRIRVDTYQPLFFNLSAKVLIDHRYVWADVEAAVKAAIVDAFAFERRSFGRSVSVMEVVTIIQRTPGVVFVDLDALHRFDQPASLPSDDLLAADGVTWSESEPEPSGLAQLLLVNPLGIVLTPVPQESVA